MIIEPGSKAYWDWVKYNCKRVVVKGSWMLGCHLPAGHYGPCQADEPALRCRHMGGWYECRFAMCPVLNHDPGDEG